MSSSEAGRCDADAAHVLTYIDPKTWSVARVVQWLRTEGLAEFAPLFEGDESFLVV